MNLYNLFNKSLNEDTASLGMGGGAAYMFGGGAGASGYTSPENNTSPIGSGAGDMEECDQYGHPVTEHGTIDEAAMRPSAFKQAISQGAEKGVLVGFEFETLIPAQSVRTWKLGPQTQAPGGYDANSTAWIDGKTTNDLIDGMMRIDDGSISQLHTILDDLFIQNKR